METILFIGSATSGSSLDAFEAANRLGYGTILVTNRKTFIHNKNNFPFIDKVIYVNVMDEDTIRKQILYLIDTTYTLQAIISFVDPYTSLAARLSNEYCDSSISSDALQILEDKSTTREVLKDHPATCEFKVINGKQLIHSSMDYPFVLKKPVSNGSKDVYLIENEVHLNAALKKMATQNPVIIEEFVEGDQYVIEVIVCNGLPIIVAIIKQEITMDYTFIVTGYEVVLKMDDAIYRNLWKSVISILGEIGLKHGACHLEMRLSKKGWKLIEINPRISGGAMNRMIFEAFGVNLVQETVKLYLGKEPDLLVRKRQPVYTSFITIHSYGYLLGIEGEDEAASSSGIVDIHLRPMIGVLMMPPISMGQRYGYVMAIGDTTVEAKERAEMAARCIKFYVEPI